MVADRSLWSSKFRNRNGPGLIHIVNDTRKSHGEIPRWQLEGGSRKCASYSEILEVCWRHILQAKPPKRGKTLTPFTPQASAEHLYFTLNGEIRRTPGPPVAHIQMAWEDVDKVILAVPWYSHRQPWVRAA
jgi:hypothetical protein